MSLTEARFHDLVDATQQALEDIFDDSGLDVDLEATEADFVLIQPT
jgi:CyaY protein